MMPGGPCAGPIRPPGPPPPAAPVTAPAGPPALPVLCYHKLVYHNLQCLMVLHHPFRSGYKKLATSSASTTTRLYDKWTMHYSQTQKSLYKMPTNSTRIGRERREALDANEEAQDALNREYDVPLLERAAGRTNAAIEGEIDVLRNAHRPLQRDYDEWLDRVERGGDYLNYILIHGTKLRTEANNYVRRLQRSTNGFEALRLLRLRYTTTLSVSTMARITEPLRTGSTTTTR